MKIIKKQELEKLYKKLSNKDLARKLNISQSTLLCLLKDSNISLKGKGNRSARGKQKIKVIED